MFLHCLNDETVTVFMIVVITFERRWYNHLYSAIVLVSGSSHHVVDDIDVVGDSTHVVTLLHVGPLWISSSQDGTVSVGLQQADKLKNIAHHILYMHTAV